jgi:hypothetical protein
VDKRINFLNTLKKRLNAYIIADKEKKNYLHQKNQISFINHSILQAQMLCENVQSGLALREITFYSSKAYAEFSNDGTLNFHIYPTIKAVRDPYKGKLDGHTEIEEQKLIYSRVR